MEIVSSTKRTVLELDVMIEKSLSLVVKDGGYRMQLAMKQGERGFVLIPMAIISVALIGVLGMAVDVGRAFIAKNETQAFCDAASMAAVLKLDGTSTGIS